MPNSLVKGNHYWAKKAPSMILLSENMKLFPLKKYQKVQDLYIFSKIQIYYYVADLH